MIKLRHYSSLSIAPVFLLLPLNLQAQNTTQLTAAVQSTAGVQSTATVQSSAAVEPTTTVQSSAAVEPTTAVQSSAAVEPTTTVQSSAAVEPTTTVQSSAAVEPTTAVQSSAAVEPTTAVQSSAAVEPTTAVQSSAAVEPTTAVQSSAAVEPTTAVQSSAAVEPTTAVQSSAAVEPTTAVQSSAAVEPTTAVQSSAAVEPTTAVQSSAAVQSTTAVQSSAAVEPTTAVQSSAAVEPTTAVQSSAAVEPTTAVQSSAAVEPTTAVQSSAAVEPTTAVQSSAAVEPTTAVQSSAAVEPTTAVQSSAAVEQTAAVQPTARVQPSAAVQSTVTAQSSTAAPTTATPHPTELCSSLRGQTTGVQQRLEDSDLVSGRQCVVLSADPADDLSELIKQIPDNTVILLSSKTTSPTVAPVTGKPTAEYLIANAITLKNGQDLIGAADDGYEIVIKLHDNFKNRYMIGVGVDYDDKFNFGETADNHIKHITFRPTGVNPDTQTDDIVHTNCYYRSLSIENNVFYLPVWAAVNISCSANLDASTSDLHTGPGLRFANNKVIGETIRTTKLSMIPEEAIFINLRNINNLSNKLEIIGNTFRGKISELADIAIGSGSNINIFRNTVDIDNKGKTRSEIRTGIETRRGGFALKGLFVFAHRKAPLINLVGNNINVTRTALTIYDKLDLALTCNHFRGMTLWKVDNEYFPLKAVDPLPLADKCPRSVSSTVGMATTSAPTLCQIVNSWTPINDSKATALTGLTNVEGQFYFDSAVCMRDPQSSASITNATFNINPVSTSSADTIPVTNALGVIASITNATTNATFNINPVSTSSADTIPVTNALGVIASLAILLNL